MVNDKERELFNKADFLKFAEQEELFLFADKDDLLAIAEGCFEYFKLRQAAIASLQNQEPVGKLRINENGEYSFNLPLFGDSEDAFKEFIARVGIGEHELYLVPPQSLAVQEWISVDDRLPVFGEWYLVTVNNGMVTMAFLDGVDGDCLWLSQNDYERNKGEDNSQWENVTHWQPLPQPPKASHD